MAIAAKRFQFPNLETNVAISSFTKGLSGDVLNDPANVLKEASESLNSLVDSAQQKAEGFLSQLTSGNPLAAITRASKDIKGTVSDIKGLPGKAMEEALGGIVGNNSSAIKGLKSVLEQCSKPGLGTGLPGKPYDASMNCGAGNIKVGQAGSMGGGGGSSCNASSFNDILNKLTGGGYNASFNDFNSALKSLMALAGYGYNLGMCGVFGALSKGLPTDVLSKGAGSLLSSLGSASNVNGFLDVAKSSVGLTPLALSPSGISDMLGNYTHPDWLKQSNFGDMAERLSGGMELLKDDWNKSLTDGSLSIADAMGHSKDLAESFVSKVSDRSYGEDDLDISPNSDEDFYAASLSSDEDSGDSFW